MNDFKKNLKLFMSENNITQGKLAEVLNVKQQTISRYITGEREPDIDVIIKIAKFFNLTVGQLVGTEES
ncbi:MAG: helix-turn-helix domain-containing protein [Firmicutes bacterium]|nr:helix-turn-helix domain-containing protein [Bacillota bacterium]